MNKPLDHDRHLLDIPSLSVQEIEHYIDRGQFYADKLAKGDYKDRPLQGKLLLNLFFEPSTRTRVSFEVAAKRLGAQVVNWDPEGSSLKKGESFSDTILTLGAMQPDGLIIRHSKYNTPHMVAQMVDCPVINAGDSWRAHPSQALLDALTIVQHKGHIGDLTVAICGDITHSRVASCNIALLSRLGATVHLVGPANFLPASPPSENIRLFTSMDEGIAGADVVMMLRVQKERIETSQLPDLAAYYKNYGLTMARLAKARPDVIVMHPAPMNRGVEIADEVADHPQHSVIQRQVTNGVAMRMAILTHLLGA